MVQSLHNSITNWGPSLQPMSLWELFYIPTATFCPWYWKICVHFIIQNAVSLFSSIPKTLTIQKFLKSPRPNLWVPAKNF
jgi:hypothetical protein